MTDNLAKFTNTLCSSFEATIGTRAEERAACEAILNSGHDRALLRLMRQETAPLVLMVRVEVQAQREQYQTDNGFGSEDD